MILYPAIDIKDGKCVRLIQGHMDQATIFADDPVLQAKRFIDEGASWLHLVDLNGAFSGKSINRAAIEAILKSCRIPCQLGGGIRSRADIESWLEKGIARVILGSAAIADPAMVKEAAKAYPDRIVLGLDAKAGKIAIEGWAKQTAISLVDLAKTFEDAGIAAIIHTDIERDGLLAGLNFPASEELAEAVSIPVIVSGGCKSLEDILALRKTRLAGAILGRALYNGEIQLAKALEILAHA